MTTCRGAVGEEPLGGRARLGGRVGDLPRRDRQALGDEQRLGVGFLDLHARVGLLRGRSTDGRDSADWYGPGSPATACRGSPRGTAARMRPWPTESP